MTRILSSLAEIGANYSVALVDLWGCVHDGLRIYPAAASALQAFRKGGGVVVLVTNAPRTAAWCRRGWTRCWRATPMMPS